MPLITNDKRTAFNLMLNKQERDALAKLAAARNCTQGAVLRACLLAAHTHQNGGHCCANGERCLVPQMHVGRNTV